MRKIPVVILCLLMMTVTPFFSQEAEGGLGEANMWETIPCDYNDGDGPTTLVDGGDGYLYIGSYDSDGLDAGIYRYDGTTCTPFQETSDYYISTSVVYNGSIYWGTRWRSWTQVGQLWRYDIAADSFALEDRNVWWNNLLPAGYGGWVQKLYVHDDRLFLSGSIMAKAIAPWLNNFWMKYCFATDCANAGDWAWVTTDEVGIGEIDDAISMATAHGELYVGTYDPAIILRYYNSNQSVWHSLNEQYAQAIYSTYPDGVPDTTASQGFYGLTVRDGVLNAFSYAWGHNWSLAYTGGTWEYSNRTMNSQFARSILFNNEIYYGVLNSSGFQRIGTYNNITFNQVFQCHQREQPLCPS
jgi:hypothetical protein